MKVTALVSGGSKGLGLEICSSLLEKGCNVFSFARQSTNYIKDLLNKYPSQFVFKSLDATDYHAIKYYISEIKNGGCNIDILINNAAIGQDHLLVHMDYTSIARILKINLEAPIVLTKMVLKEMFLQDEGGKIINISSICARKGYAGLSIYSAAKAAMESFSRCLVHEIDSKSITINSISPGFFNSDMSSVLSEEQIEVITRRTPTKKLTSNKEIVELVNFLVFNRLNITGQVFNIDGGASI